MTYILIVYILHYNIVVSYYYNIVLYNVIVFHLYVIILVLYQGHFVFLRFYYLENKAKGSQTIPVSHKSIKDFKFVEHH